MKAYVGGSFRNEDTLVRSSDIGATKVVLDRNSESGLRCLDINLILRALNRISSSWIMVRKNILVLHSGGLCILQLKEEGPIELNLCDSPELGPLPNPLILARFLELLAPSRVWLLAKGRGL
ncbi:hypothetical protein MRB53_027430 [Persea americana]|uniref:Uncharacterized protein n=1 Tax=Persea americana TaxID=3435 RepID=A0ACC2LM11_PERAE|nr:hypothetical protein MRB53_027430 [Persea americana]